MDASYLLRGLAIGFAVAAPVGPIGVLCIRRSLVDGRAFGFVSGLGAATADAIYGSVAAFGLTAISRLLLGQTVWLRLIGGAFLCWLGVRTLRAKPAEDGSAPRRGGLGAAYVTTVGLTLTNPATILSFAAIFAAIGPGDANASYASAALLVAGVFLGSAAWWLILSGTVGSLRERLDQRWLRRVNWVSGAVLLGFGLVAFASLWLG